ncbi:MAG: GTP-binding protein, partial [Pseudomonadota bacterium]
LFEDQIACADLILVNKTDLLAGGGAEALAARLRADARAGVQVVEASHGVVAPEILLGLGIGAEDDLAARQEVHHHHHDHDHDHDEDDDHHHHDDHGHDAFESFVVDLPEITDPAALAARVESAIRAHDLLRVKGFAAVAGKPMRLVLQAVGPRLSTHFDRPFTDTELRATRLVVIAEAGVDRDAVLAALGAEAVAA